MASTYVNDLRLNEMATGDESGNWGNVTNTNLELIGEALGYGTEAITTNADTHTSTIADGATDPVRAMYVKYTGSLDSACTITIAPNTVNRMHFIENATSGSQNIIISQGSGANVTIPNGDVKAVYLDGAGSGAAVVDAFASLSVVDLKVQDDLTVTDDISVGGAATITGVLDVTDTTDASDATGDTGAVRTEGGASIAKKLYVGTDLDVDGTANLDVVDIDGAVDMASTLQVDGAITTSSGATFTTGDNLAQLTLVSTDGDANAGPVLDFYRNSGGPADGDLIGRLNFRGRNDNSQDVDYAAWHARIMDASDGTEDGSLRADIMTGGSALDVMTLYGTEVVINESSGDVDFRVETNGNQYTLKVDGGTDEVRVPHNIAAQTMAGLIVRDNGAALEYGHQNNGAQYYGTLGAFGSSGAPYIGFSCDSEASANTFTTRGAEGSLITSGSGNMQFMAVTGASSTGQTPAERFRIRNAGGVTFNGDTAAANALDDYEVGTFTPTIYSSGGSTPNYTASAAVGDYVKIGDIVHANFLIIVTGVTDNGGSGNKGVDGFPFDQNQNSYQQVGIIGYNDVWGDAVTRGYMTGGNFQIMPTGVTQSNYGGVITTGYFAGQISYTTNS
jgi:hypothetical protein